jgi:guanylate kinase
MKMGPLIILSGPSASGKSTVIDRVLATRPPLPVRLSVSATTRAPREAEKDGVHYHFWTGDRERFRQAINAGCFLEWAQVYGDNYYGTLKDEVEPYRLQRMGVILDIDVQGALQVKKQCPEVVRVLLRASSMAEYEKRLRSRQTEDEASIQRRLGAAAGEIERAADYEYTVINDDLDTAVAQFRAIIEQQFA